MKWPKSIQRLFETILHLLLMELHWQKKKVCLFATNCFRTDAEFDAPFDTDSNIGSGKCYRIGFSDMMGRRPTMEDSVIIKGSLIVNNSLSSISLFV
jgi:hypothetical protein